MSQTYTYYICTRNEDSGQLYPLGPYDSKGTFHSAYQRAKVFSSPIKDLFVKCTFDDISPRLKQALDIEDEYLDESNIATLDAVNLPDGPICKEGYFLMDDIMHYKKYGYSDDIFNDYLTCDQYAMYAANGDSRCKLYSYFRYIDTMSANYEGDCIRNIVNLFLGHCSEEIVILRVLY